MKKIKLKLLSLALCLCVSLSVFSGCSLFTKKNSNNNVVALKIAGKEITKQDLIDSYYSFYQQNQYYFMYYDNETIMKVFYDAIVSREVVLAEANKLLSENKIKFSQEDMDDIWNDVSDYVYSQIDAKEKGLLLLKDSDEEKLPERLQSEDEDKETPYKYEPYKCEELVKIDYSTVTSAPESNVDEKIIEIKEGIYTYNASLEEDERDMKDIPEEERAVRLEAFEMYLSDLILSAKANKKDFAKDVVFKAEIERIYESYYETALYNKYQELVETTAAGVNYDGIANFEKEDGKFVNKLSDSIIEEKYLELLNKSAESNSVYENYVSVITASNNESLILYHHEGKYTYFTVQHLLVSFDDETLEILKDTDGYDSTKDSLFRESYEAIRATYSKDEDMKTSYRDENGYTVKDNEGNALKISVKEIRDLYNAELTSRLADFDARPDSDFASAEIRNLERTRIKTLLFNEFAWKYSGDTGSLTNEKLSGVLGFTISSETDNHGSLVKDFANGARNLYEAYLSDSNANGIGSTIASVVSDYGTHMMMLTGVYEAGAVAESVEELKTSYVSNLTEQTLYEYVYDMVKDELVGDSGTYFTDYRKSLVKHYEEEELIEWVDKMSYKELTNAIS